MEELQVTLQTLLQQYFHVVPVHTQRQDQWYKRTYDSWKKMHQTQEPLILTPRESSDEWAPQVNQYAVQFSREIENAVRLRRAAKDHSTILASFTPSDAKIFADTALDQNQANTLGSAIAEPLVPLMQRFSFWTSHSHLKRAEAIKSLLVSGQIQSLLYLAGRDGSATRTVAYGGNDVGWEGLVDDLLEIAIFLSIVQSFEKQLTVQKGYECWIPIVFGSRDTAVGRYLEARPTKHLTGSERELQRDWEQCFQVLSMTQMLFTSCGLEPIDWESRFANAFLLFVGFESWNRAREGHAYLPCGLNVTKDGKWLRTRVAQAHHEDDAPDTQQALSETRSKSPRPPDPLHLRGPKEEITPEPESEEEEERQRLAVMESEEVSYGRRRSTKYQRKKAGVIE